MVNPGAAAEYALQVGAVSRTNPGADIECGYDASGQHVMVIDRYPHHRQIPAELLLIAPLFALSTTLNSSLAAALLFLLLLVVIAVTVSILRHFIAWRLRIPFLILIIATWISLFDIAATTYFYGLREQLGIYMTLLAYNSLVFAAAEEYYLRLPVRQSLLHAVRTGMVIFTLFLATGTVRELLSFGKLGSGLGWSGADGFLHPVSATGLAITQAAPGAFICVGLLFGLWNYCAGKFRYTRQQT